MWLEDDEYTTISCIAAGCLECHGADRGTSPMAGCHRGHDRGHVDRSGGCARERGVCQQLGGTAANDLGTGRASHLAGREHQHLEQNSGGHQRRRAFIRPVAGAGPGTGDRGCLAVRFPHGLTQSLQVSQETPMKTPSWVPPKHSGSQTDQATILSGDDDRGRAGSPLRANTLIARPQGLGCLP